MVRVLSFTDQFAGLSGLRAAMTERARSQEVVADFVSELDALLSRMLSNAFRGHIPDEELPIGRESMMQTSADSGSMRIQKCTRYRYRLQGGDLDGAIDFAFSELLFKPGHAYRVRFNDEQANPWIVESFDEVPVACDRAQRV